MKNTARRKLVMSIIGASSNITSSRHQNTSNIVEGSGPTSFIERNSPNTAMSYRTRQSGTTGGTTRKRAVTTFRGERNSLQ